MKLNRRSGDQLAHQVVFTFRNGFTVSAIDDGYGGEEGLTEVLVSSPASCRRFIGVTADLDDSNIGGWLNDDELVKLLSEVSRLRPASEGSTVWKVA